ncbi:hypothetical protein [Paenibacillus typhae]|uniref:hypothetical protein n=1 Tax=Paenibacillus typhae TaxID=1174501 RepID=UPI001C8D21B1|nr:hypothetical protein [Paenibacillus typhae]
MSCETLYVCFLFYQELGGYVRFNIAYQQEMAIVFEQDAEQESTVEGIQGLLQTSWFQLMQNKLTPTEYRCQLESENKGICRVY